jgi:hypothetical protein
MPVSWAASQDEVCSVSSAEYHVIPSEARNLLLLVFGIRRAPWVCPKGTFSQSKPLRRTVEAWPDLTQPVLPWALRCANKKVKIFLDKVL